MSLDDASESEPDGPGERPSTGLSEPSDLESSHDVTSEVDPSPSAPRVTRHEASESHHGVSLTSLTARVDEDGDLLILAEVHALESGELPDDVEIVFVIKDQNGDILQMTERLLTKDRFHTLDVLRVWFFGHGRNTCEVLVFARAG